MNIVKSFYCIGILLLGFVNLLLVKYHFYVSQNDGSLYSDKSGNILDVIDSFSELWTHRFSSFFSVIAVFLFCGSILGNLIKKEKKGNICFEVIFVSFLFVSVVAGMVTKYGVPQGRELVPVYPIWALAIGEALDNIFATIKSPSKSAIRNIGRICIVLLAIYSFTKKIDLSCPMVTSSSYFSKEVAYDLFYQNERKKVSDIVPWSESIAFYRLQIMDRYGFDIFTQ